MISVHPLISVAAVTETHWLETQQGRYQESISIHREVEGPEKSRQWWLSTEDQSTANQRPDPRRRAPAPSLRRQKDFDANKD